jgi:hypothetical protein
MLRERGWHKWRHLRTIPRTSGKVDTSPTQGNTALLLEGTRTACAGVGLGCFMLLPRGVPHVAYLLTPIA